MNKQKPCSSKGARDHSPTLLLGNHRELPTKPYEIHRSHCKKRWRPSASPIYLAPEKGITVKSDTFPKQWCLEKKIHLRHRCLGRSEPWPLRREGARRCRGTPRRPWMCSWRASASKWIHSGLSCSSSGHRPKIHQKPVKEHIENPKERG